MTRVQQLEQDALTPTDSERAVLATRLLQTLPALLSDEDEGVAEALRRDAELDANPASGISWEELKEGLAR